MIKKYLLVKSFKYQGDCSVPFLAFKLKIKLLYNVYFVILKFTLVNEKFKIIS